MLTLALTFACAGPSGPASAVSGPHQVTVELAKPSQGARRKSFSGVFLKPEHGESWVASYTASPLWRRFDGRRVLVTGRTYQPPGQALINPHFEVDTLKLVGEASTWTGFGPEAIRPGELKIRTGEPMSKREGESWPVFVDSKGTAWQLVNPEAVQITGRVDLRSREISMSPGAAHDGGPFLYVEEAAMAK